MRDTGNDTMKCVFTVNIYIVSTYFFQYVLLDMGLWLQLDGLNEKILQEADQRLISKFEKVFNKEPFRLLIDLLDSRGFLSDRSHISLSQFLFFVLDGSEGKKK